jgi:hypothetical protein
MPRIIGRLKEKQRPLQQRRCSLVAVGAGENLSEIMQIGDRFRMVPAVGLPMNRQCPH